MMTRIGRTFATLLAAAFLLFATGCAGTEAPPLDEPAEAPDAEAATSSDADASANATAQDSSESAAATETAAGAESGTDEEATSAAAPESAQEGVDASDGGPTGEDTAEEAGTAAGSEGVVLVEELFDEYESDNWELWGTVAPFNRIEVYEGVLELEGSNGMEGFGVYFLRELDLAEGEVTISMDITRNSSNDGSEICVWFVNQYLPNGSPWDEGDFIRANFLSNTRGVKVQATSPDLRGMGTDVAIKNAVWTPGEAFHLDFVLNTETFTIFIDGEQVATGQTNGLTATTGFLHIHDWNSLEGDIDLVDNVVIRQAAE